MVIRDRLAAVGAEVGAYVAIVDDMTPAWVNHGLSYLGGMGLVFVALFAGVTLGQGAAFLTATLLLAAWAMLAFIWYDGGLEDAIAVAKLLAIMLLPTGAASYTYVAAPTAGLQQAGAVLVFVVAPFSLYVWGLYEDPSSDDVDEGQDEQLLEVSA